MLYLWGEVCFLGVRRVQIFRWSIAQTDAVSTKATQEAKRPLHTGPSLPQKPMQCSRLPCLRPVARLLWTLCPRDRRGQLGKGSCSLLPPGKMGSRSTLVSILLCICFLFKRGWAQAGPEDPFAGHLAADGWPLRVCWAAEEPGHTMRVLPVQYDEEDFNVTAAALRHMLELGLDDLQSRKSPRRTRVCCASRRPTTCRGLPRSERPGAALPHGRL